MKYIILLINILFFSIAFGQVEHDFHSIEDEIKVIKSFISDLGRDSVPIDIVLSQHVLINSSLSEEMANYLVASLEEIRLNLQTKDIDNIQYINYHEMPKRETSDIDVDEKDVSKMYFMFYNKRQMYGLYIQNGKIASFTLISTENNKAHFLTY